MPIDPNPPKPRNEFERWQYAWEKIWNEAMTVYKSMPLEYADAYLLEKLGSKTYTLIMTQMFLLDDVIPKPMYKPNNSDEENDDHEDNFQNEDETNEEDFQNEFEAYGE